MLLTICIISLNSKFSYKTRLVIIKINYSVTSLLENIAHLSLTYMSKTLINPSQILDSRTSCHHRINFDESKRDDKLLIGRKFIEHKLSSLNANNFDINIIVAIIL